MKIATTDNQRTLKAEEGRYLTNGETYGQTVVLSLEADHTVWREVIEAELPKSKEDNV